MADEKQGLMDRALDMLDHQNDKRVVVFVVGVALIGWLSTRQTVSCDAVNLIAGLTALAILGISLRPERSAFVTVPPKPSAPVAPEAASASTEEPKP